MYHVLYCQRVTGIALAITHDAVLCWKVLAAGAYLAHLWPPTEIQPIPQVLQVPSHLVQRMAVVRAVWMPTIQVAYRKAGTKLPALPLRKNSRTLWIRTPQGFELRKTRRRKTGVSCSHRPPALTSSVWLCAGSEDGGVNAVVTLLMPNRTLSQAGRIMAV